MNEHTIKHVYDYIESEKDLQQSVLPEDRHKVLRVVDSGDNVVGYYVPFYVNERKRLNFLEVQKKMSECLAYYVCRCTLLSCVVKSITNEGGITISFKDKHEGVVSISDNTSYLEVNSQNLVRNMNRISTAFIAKVVDWIKDLRYGLGKICNGRGIFLQASFEDYLEKEFVECKWNLNSLIYCAGLSNKEFTLSSSTYSTEISNVIEEDIAYYKYSGFDKSMSYTSMSREQFSSLSNSDKGTVLLIINSIILELKERNV